MIEEPGLHGSHGLVGDPTNPLTGEYLFSRTDLTVPGVGIPFEFTRAYGSNSSINGPLGPKWTHTYNRTLTMLWNYSMDVRDEQGRRWHYRFIPDPEIPVDSFDGDPLIEISLDLGYFVSSVLNSNTLHRNLDGTYVERTKEGLEYHYDGYWAKWRGENQKPTAGKLLSITDRNGNRISLTYDEEGRLIRVEDTVGRRYDLFYEGHLLVELRDPEDRRWRYGYDESGRLTQVANPIGAIWQFAYDSEGRMTRRTSPLGPSVRYRYDEEGRVSEVFGLDGSLINRFRYERGDLLRTEYTDMAGGKTVYVFDATGHLIEVQHPSGGVTQHEYDDGFNRIRSAYSEEGETRARYDERKNVVEWFEPSGEAYRFTYEPDFNGVTRIVDGRGNVTELTYDDRGNLIRVVDPQNGTTRYTYHRNGLPATVTDPEGRVTAFVYDEQGNLVTRMEHDGALTRYTYDGLGNLLSETDPAGRTTRYHYDELGQVVRVDEPSGAQHRYTYDLEGNLVAYEDPSGRIHRWPYDRLGRTWPSLGEID
ncbi:DUF6531 domain-containing protein [Limnochorda pilosa]|uniref:Type IV secretion protein Rhs n=1 Tax=Limnochorda pilosa TaxID=1555112 RepID=A0A0K2SKD8_LIMPI|nr:DUF6531 domain-containing protein [Limnochorda pilosa]BAS27299.1 hypothetical protein LIP_1450 [Limnochorda pilosa]